MSLQLATLPPAVDRAPEPREAVAASGKSQNGAFSHAMQEAGNADPHAPVALPRPSKAAAAARNDAAHEAEPAAQPDLGTLLTQLLPQPIVQAAQAPVPGTGAAQATGTALAHAEVEQVSAQESAPGSAPAALAVAISPLLANRLASAGASPLSAAPMQGRLTANGDNAGRPGSLAASRAASTAPSLVASLAHQQDAGSDGQHALTALLARSARLPIEAGQTERPAGQAPWSTDASWAAVLAKVGDGAAAASNAPLSLPPHNPTQWREPLLNTLGERVQWQLQRGSEQAVIRLEPPNLGSIDIVVRQEAGQMQVHLSATHRDVAQQLQGISDGLRQALSLRQAADVNVQVSDQSAAHYQGQGQGRQDGQAPRARQPGRALASADEAGTTSGFSMQADRG